VVLLFPGTASFLASPGFGHLCLPYYIALFFIVTNFTAHSWLMLRTDVAQTMIIRPNEPYIKLEYTLFTHHN